MLLRRAACVLAVASLRHHHLVLEEAMRPCSAFPGKSKSLDFLRYNMMNLLMAIASLGKESSNVLRGYCSVNTAERYSGIRGV
ncbi:uncharacterized protein P174DRAFT_442080 [Aspergillus novofumigatus IBT 16806]|uniref:Uncharacterized protein n=1 Tax=Aspergillus novofumigatus (strain IBT 16806) TaxID=1392255 RepID=A0A2I1CAV5_ASPN1|nr:uncharacterized protein P174DRAFT_442080 [Aspergillus novofumigatus IBT 16806]PKX94752.1 hypothetical protein P174DRAFT_442080 [Aspergillus novofumigatus IBT 16806]